MFKTSRQKTIVGLEIESGSAAAVEVSVNGSARVKAHGVVPLAPGIFREGEVVDQEALAEALKTLFSANSLSKEVRLGVSNQRVVVRRIRLPAIAERDDLEAAIRFQAQEEIPMPIESATLDWVVDGERRGENGERQLDVVVVAARRDMVFSLLGAMRQAGLRPVGVDLSAFAMIRALAYADSGSLVTSPAGLPASSVAGPDQPTAPLDATADVDEQQLSGARPVRLYCNLGDVLTVAVTDGSSCLFARVSLFGIEGIAQRLAERRRLTLEHARQWLMHVGVDRSPAEIEGDPGIVAATSETLVDGIAKLAEELRLSLQAYSAQPEAQPVESVVACGSGTVIPGLVARLEREVGYPVSAARPAALTGLDPLSAARLSVPYGLSLDGET